MDKLQLMDAVVRAAQRAVPELAIVYCMWRYNPETHFSTKISSPKGMDLDSLIVNADHALTHLWSVQAAIDDVVKDVPTENEMTAAYGQGLKGFPTLEEAVKLCFEAGWNIWLFAESPSRAGSEMKIREDKEARVTLKHAFLDCKRELTVEWSNAVHPVQMGRQDSVILAADHPLSPDLAAFIHEKAAGGNTLTVDSSKFVDEFCDWRKQRQQA